MIIFSSARRSLGISRVAAFARRMQSRGMKYKGTVSLMTATLLRLSNNKIFDH